MDTCRNTLSAYSHWHCQRHRFHFGRHRFNNYTGARFPRFWLVGHWRRTVNANRRLRGYSGGDTAPRLVSHRRYLFPVRFNPIPVEMPDHVRSFDSAKHAGLA